MSQVSTYLNFMGRTEEAFEAYAKVFGTARTPIFRMGDMPLQPGAPALGEAERDLVAHVELPILAGHVLMGTDMLESMGHELRIGNNVTINLQPDSRQEADRLYQALAEGTDGPESTGMMEMPFGYWGCTLDRFGIRWMITVTPPGSQP